MSGRLLADFHVHTQASDGIGSVQDVRCAAIEQGLAAVAITDHDTLTGAEWCYGYMHHLARRGDDASVKMIPGVEISSKLERDGEIDIVHILGLGIDPFDDELKALCDELQAARRIELERRLARARELGLGLDPEAEGRVRARGFWGKSEISREEVLAGRFESVDVAYHTLWDGYPRLAPLAHFAPAPAAIYAIHSAGGIAVLAHPLRNEAARGQVSVEAGMQRMDLLQPLGLDGAECYYSSFALADCELLESHARKRGLIVSAGSDHHDFHNRYRLGKTCADGQNYASRTNILEALGLAGHADPTA